MEAYNSNFKNIVLVDVFMGLMVVKVEDISKQFLQSRAIETARKCIVFLVGFLDNLIED